MERHMLGSDVSSLLPSVCKDNGARTSHCCGFCHLDVRSKSRRSLIDGMRPVIKAGGKRTQTTSAGILKQAADVGRARPKWCKFKFHDCNMASCTVCGYTI